MTLLTPVPQTSPLNPEGKEDRKDRPGPETYKPHYRNDPRERGR